MRIFKRIDMIGDSVWRTIAKNPIRYGEKTLRSFAILTALISVSASFTYGAETKLHRLIKRGDRESAITYIHSICSKPTGLFGKLSSRIRNPKRILEGKDSDGDTPLTLTARMQENQLLSLLLEKCDFIGPKIKNEILLDTIRANNIEGAIILLESGLGLDYADKDGRTPLITTSELGNFELVEYLLQHGANLNQEFSNGSRAFAFAAQNGHLEVVLKLLEAGAEIDHANREGYSALYYSLFRKRRDTEETLRKKDHSGKSFFSIEGQRQPHT